MAEHDCDVLIIGAGPGGYVTAIRAAQRGLTTIVVDAQPPGGTCLNVGCIPSKAVIHAAEEFHSLTTATQPNPLGIHAEGVSVDWAQTVAWKDGIVRRLTTGVKGLLRKAGATLIVGEATFLDAKHVQVATAHGEERIHATHVVIATGSTPVELPFLPFGERVISSTEALALTEIPETFVIVGGGYIGLELGTAFAKLGSQVTIVEAATQILPLYDAEIVAPVRARLAELGVEVLTATKALGLTPAGELQIDHNGEEKELPADKILVTVGRTPRLGNGIERIYPRMNGPFIAIDDQCRTSITGVYAIGDVTGEPMLAHRAMAQGEMVADSIAGDPRAFDQRVIPAVCFTDPEIVHVGLSPARAKEAASGYEVTTATFPLMANGRALTMGSESGFIQVVARADNHLILGIQAVGTDISELSASFALALENCLTLEDITGTIHAHPTQGEGLHEASLLALGHALHI